MAEKSFLGFDSISLFFNQMGIIAIVDQHGIYVYVSDAWARESNVPPEEAIGKSVFEFYPNSNVMKAIKTGKPLLAEPIPAMNNKKDTVRHFTSYFPISKNNDVIGCVIQTFFRNDTEVLHFSRLLEKLSQERDYYQNELKMQQNRYSITSIIGKSAEIEKLKDQILRASYGNSTVLIDGETGTGKELVAQAIHNLSSRSAKAMIKLNCSAIPLELAESELFGYEHGAFTGARSGGSLGKFELADKSTLFFDEIDSLSPTVQPKLLRALQEKEIVKIGSGKTVPVDVRIIAATNKSLYKLVKEGKFREDLFYRLNVINIHVPPLRERIDDIPLLIYNFIDRLNPELGTYISGIDQDAVYELQQYRWPGNIRELQNVIERAMTETRNGLLTRESFEDYFNSAIAKDNPNLKESKQTSLSSVRKETDRDYIMKALLAHNGNKKKTAEYLGISRTQLYNKLREFGITL